MKQTDQTKVALYCRTAQSSDMAIECQMERLKFYAKQQGLTMMGERVMFSGLLFCAGCGEHLNQHRTVSLPPDRENYVCSSYRKRTGNCTAHDIRTSVLEQLVTEDLRRVTHFAAEHEKQFVELMVTKTMKEHRREINEAQRALEAQQARINE